MQPAEMTRHKNWCPCERSRLSSVSKQTAWMQWHCGCNIELRGFSSKACRAVKLIFPTTVYSVTWSTSAFVSAKPSMFSSRQWGFKTMGENTVQKSNKQWAIICPFHLVKQTREKGRKHYLCSKLCHKLHMRLVIETLSNSAATFCSAGFLQNESLEFLLSRPSPSIFAPV